MFKLTWTLAVTLMTLPGLALSAAVDPTRPPAALAASAPATAAPVQGPKLEGIRTQGKSRQALIDGKFYSTGERLGNARISRIESRAVVLTRDGKAERLELGLPLTKQWKKQDK
ncbi:hypothetical protein [Motiliproteus sediminis]|uniref:hypothetical protein n=1 Tax=Motiliproteus sediminis TaxID=1468178 RepID=UPI001AEFDDCA|nr:hypothetical protein [Motiliproteus sediminis]